MGQSCCLVFALLVCTTGMADEPLYLGQKPPGKVPELFAPGLVNTGLYTRDLTMTPDGKEIYFSVFQGSFARATIVGSRIEKGRWSEPEVPSFASDSRWHNLEPCISPDGKQFFFVSNRSEDPSATQPVKMGIWVMDRIGHGWSEPRRLSAPINGSFPSYFPSVTLDGTLYFSREDGAQRTSIWRARRSPKGYLNPERLPAQVNTGQDRYNAWVAPDESLLILGVIGRPDSLGGTDYYVVFHRRDDAWSEPINLGELVNTEGNEEYSASLSADGKFLFFMSARIRKDTFAAGEKLTFRKLKDLAMQPGVNGNAAIYWMEAEFLNDLRKKAVFGRP